MILNWTLSGFIIFIVNYGLFPYADEDASPVIHPVFELIFGLFQRTLWSTNLAWIIFSDFGIDCIHHFLGFLDDYKRRFKIVIKQSYIGRVLKYDSIL